MFRRGLPFFLLLLAAPSFSQDNGKGALAQLQLLSGNEPVEIPSAPGVAVPLETYSGGPDDSKVNFKGSGWGFKVRGTFSKFTISAGISRQDFTQSQITVIVEANSIECAGAPEFLVHRALNPGKYPTISLKSTAIRPLPEPGQYEVDLDVDAKGKIRKETLILTVDPVDADSVKLHGEFAKTGKKGAGALDFETVLSRTN